MDWSCFFSSPGLIQKGFIQRASIRGFSEPSHSRASQVLYFRFNLTICFLHLSPSGIMCSCCLPFAPFWNDDDDAMMTRMMPRRPGEKGDVQRTGESASKTKKIASNWLAVSTRFCCCIGGKRDVQQWVRLQSVSKHLPWRIIAPTTGTTGEDSVLLSDLLLNDGGRRRRSRRNWLFIYGGFAWQPREPTDD